ncbi:MAG: sugar ABC transporter substrate-binding protein [Spirochaetales bacterium]
MRKLKIVFQFLLMALVVTSLAAFGAKEDDGKYHLGIAIHSLDNEYWAQEARGAELFAASVDNLETQILTSNSDDNRQIQGIKDFIAQHGDKAIIVVDPTSAANTANIVEICEDAGVYVSILAHRAEGLFPEDYNHFAVHMTQDDITAGYNSAKYLFDSIGGSGKVFELYGQLGNDAAALRHEGFELALKEYPNIEMVEMQVAAWSQEESLKITETWLANHNQIDGIFAANDTMALGAVEALRNAKLNGIVKVTGCDGIEAAFDAVKAGDMISTIANDGFMIMGYGAAYAYYAAIGEIDLAKDFTPEERMIITKTAFVTEDNIDEMIASYITGTPSYDYSDLDFATAFYQDRSKLK